MADQPGYVGAIQAAAEACPDRPATLFEGRTRSWRQTVDRAARVAGGLQALGVSAGDRVGILSANSDDYLMLYLAVPWAGAVLVPLNCRWSETENRIAIEDCRPTLIFVSDDMAEANAALFAAEGPELVSLGAPRPGWRTLDELVAADPVEDAGRGGDDLLAIFYTGGTTGRSKGVMLSHAGLLANCRAMRGCGLYPAGCRALIVPPLFHLAAAAMLTAAMLAGGTAVIGASFDPAGTLDLIAEAGVTDALLVPTMIQMMLDAPGFDPARLARVETHPLRRLADAGGDAGPDHGGGAARRFRPAVRHDRSVVHRDPARPRISPRRPPRGGPAPRRGAPPADRRDRDRRRRRQPSARR